MKRAQLRSLSEVLSMKYGLTLAVVCCALLSASAARAQRWPATDPNFNGSQVATVPTADKFGQAGQVVIASDFHVDFGYTSVKPPAGPSVSSTLIRVAPSVDYFVVRNLAVGGVL